MAACNRRNATNIEFGGFAKPFRVTGKAHVEPQSNKLYKARMEPQRNKQYKARMEPQCNKLYKAHMEPQCNGKPSNRLQIARRNATSDQLRANHYPQNGTLDPKLACYSNKCMYGARQREQWLTSNGRSSQVVLDSRQPGR